jgi:large subunit ribosomal protein L29
MATAKELKELTLEDLGRRANELRETLFQDQLKLKTGTLDAPSERVNHRRDLARVLTVMTQKTAAEKAPKSAPATKAKAAKKKTAKAKA